MNYSSETIYYNLLVIHFYCDKAYGQCYENFVHDIIMGCSFFIMVHS